MLTAVIRSAAAVLLAAGLLTGCSSTTSGSGAAEVPTRADSTSTPDFPIAPATSGPSAEPTTPVASTSTSSTIHPAPATPQRTIVVEAGTATYVVKIWWDIKDATCFDHAYGQQMIAFLIRHPCSGLHRYLATTTVNGRTVGFALSSTGFPGKPNDLYGEAGKFAKLERADGTGSLNDLLREGYRLPAGPTSVPSSEAFNVLGQDQGVTVWDAWYIVGTTPANDPTLIQMTQDLFLRF
jgi:hypothetical protein